MTTGTTKIRIAVVSSREISRESLAALLSAQPGFEVVTTASYGTALVEQIRRTAPDVLLFESDESGETPWLSWLRATYHSDRPNAVLLWASLSEESVLVGFEMGLRGVIVPVATTKELFTCVRTVHAGECWIGRERIADVMDYLRKIRTELAWQRRTSLA